ncbi:MchS3 family protein [Collimonas humicola]|uniref:MchS3 family protein n=1 Tax=Collimonas humicola TaxID=2825886 RepID=UPI001B8C2BD5|nr:MchS3 family protein [Collimonas humicola]
MKKNLTANSSLAKILVTSVCLSLFTCLTIPSLASDISLVTDSVKIKPSDDESVLATTENFAIGMVGFVGHTSSGESAYRNILKKSDAKLRFYEIFKSSDSTYAAKLYSACGLKTLSSSKFKEVSQSLVASKDQVTTMKADVMRKEAVSEVMKRIDRFGC